MAKFKVGDIICVGQNLSERYYKIREISDIQYIYEDLKYCNIIKMYISRLDKICRLASIEEMRLVRVLYG